MESENGQEVSKFFGSGVTLGSRDFMDTKTEFDTTEVGRSSVLPLLAGRHHFANNHAGNYIFNGMSSNRNNKFIKDVKHYLGDTLLFNNLAVSNDPRRVMQQTKKALDILEACHNGPTGGHHGATSSPPKSVFEMPGFFSLQYNKDAHEVMSWIFECPHRIRGNAPSESQEL
ncbi:hypothetical protein Tco_0514331 [Tanacetum coccineum]